LLAGLAFYVSSTRMVDEGVVYLNLFSWEDEKFIPCRKGQLSPRNVNYNQRTIFWVLIPEPVPASSSKERAPLRQKDAILHLFSNIAIFSACWTASLILQWCWELGQGRGVGVLSIFMYTAKPDRHP
jgi:hypothetical protein